MSNELVLIVEDEFAIAELMEMALIDGGFRVVMAANGRQGLQCLAQGTMVQIGAGNAIFQGKGETKN